MENKKDKKKYSNLIWSVIFILIAILCVLAVVNLNKGFSVQEFIVFLKNANLFWIILAIVFTFLYVVLEAVALKLICKELGYKIKNSAISYACADIYFSAITPSATGGQPACGYLMHKDGVPMSIVTSSLVYNIQMYTLALVLIASVTMVINFPSFWSFSGFARFLIIIGFIIQISLVTLVFFLLYKSNIIYKISKWFLDILYKLHIIKNEEASLKKLRKAMDKYQECANLLLGKPLLFFKVLMVNIFHRIFILLVPICIFMAAGNSLSDIFALYSVQTLVAIGATFIPIPGAMGVTDYLMISGYSSIMGSAMALNLELVSRGISFYCCTLIAGIVTFIRFVLLKKKVNNKERK